MFKSNDTLWPKYQGTMNEIIIFFKIVLFLFNTIIPVSFLMVGAPHNLFFKILYIYIYIYNAFHFSFKVGHVQKPCSISDENDPRNEMRRRKENETFVDKGIKLNIYIWFASE